MRTHGYKEEIPNTGACPGWGAWGRIALGERPNVDDGMIDAANHHDMCIPM